MALITPCWGCQCSAQPGRHSSLGLWGWARSGRGRPGSPTRPDPTSASPGVGTMHSIILMSGTAWGSRGSGRPSAQRAWHTQLPILLSAGLPGFPAASQVWQRVEPWLAALAAICTSRLWGRVVAPARRSPSRRNPCGLVADAEELLTVTSAARGSSAGTTQGARQP